jgi:hypothetical protein
LSVAAVRDGSIGNSSEAAAGDPGGSNSGPANSWKKAALPDLVKRARERWWRRCCSEGGWPGGPKTLVRGGQQKMRSPGWIMSVATRAYPQPAKEGLRSFVNQ